MLITASAACRIIKQKAGEPVETFVSTGSPAAFGAADEARTRYLHLGKVALYQMSYGRILETLLGLLTGASDRNRTNDTGIFSPLLYRLSYRGKWRPESGSN